jgi:predicted dehydrogenase
VCNGEAIPYQPADAFVAEVSDFVQAIQQQRLPRVTLEDGLRNVHILETAHAGKIQLPLPR